MGIPTSGLTPLLGMTCVFGWCVSALNYNLHRADNAAGNLYSGISCRLAVKIIGIAVDHHRPAQNIPHRESVGQHRQVGVSAAAK